MRSDEDGIALPMVLLVSTLLLGFALALTANALMETEIASNDQREATAFYAAETGMERAINAFRATYTVNNLPADGATIFDHVQVSYAGNTQVSDYTITVSRRDSTGEMAPFPIFYTLNCLGRQVPANNTIQPATVTLQQSLSVTPRNLANWTLFYDEIDGGLSFQSTFKLKGSLAINDLRGVNVYAGTKIDGDFYSAGAINRHAPYAVPTVSGNLQENAGKIPFPQTVDPFSNDAADPYKLNGTTRLIFSSDGNVVVWNSGHSQIYPIPPNGIIAVTGGDVIVEGTVKGRVTVTGTDDIVVNGNVQYSDHSPGSKDTLALVAQNDVIIPTKYYTGTNNLSDVKATWNGSHSVASGITGGTWGNNLANDVYIDATLVALQGSSPAVINPTGRPAGQLYIFGNSIAKIASATVRMSGDTVANGLNENYKENTRLNVFPPAGFQPEQQLRPTFFSFRELRTPIT